MIQQMPTNMKTKNKEAKLEANAKLAEFYLRYFSDRIREDRREKNLLAAELNELTEGKRIIVSNAK